LPARIDAMNGGEKVLLMELRERTSAKGNRYLAGWLGKASVVAFLDRDATEPTWQVFVSAPEPRPAGSDAPRASERSPFTPRTSRNRHGGRSPVPVGELDDDIHDLAGGDSAASHDYD
jgi:hypothetical protein